MFLSFSVLFLAILFAANLYAAASFANYSNWIGIVFSLIIIIGAKLLANRWRYLIVPAILVPGSVFLVFLIDSDTQVRIFIFLASAVFYFGTLAGWRLSQYEKDQTAKAMYNFATIATLFCWYSAAYGWYLNVAIPIWGLMIVFAAVTLVASLASFAVNRVDREKRMIYAIFLTILIAQVVWVQNFWPFGYLTTAVISLIIYCVSWEIILNYFLKKITLRSIIFEALFLVGSVTLLLLSTKWYPVI